MYITAMGERLDGNKAIEVAKFEARIHYGEVMQSIQKVGIRS